MRLPPPTTLRQTFQYFALYRAETGISSIIDSIDWAGVIPAQVYAAVLGRLPENRDVADRGIDYIPCNHFIEALNSLEFQEKLIENFLLAFSEKRRILFIHIPKCAGTDLEFDLGERFPSLPLVIADPQAVGKEDLRKLVATLSCEVPLADDIFVNGHIPLKWYLDHGVYRFGDQIFAIVREPISIIISHVNYILTVLLNDRGLIQRDTRRWLSVLGETSLPDTLSAEDRFVFARKILHNTQLVERNYLCNYLGDGTFDSILDPLAISNIEILDINRYDVWRSLKWGLPASSHINRSIPFLTDQNITSDDHEWLMEITGEDRHFYEVFSKMMTESDLPSIRGLQFVAGLNIV